MKKGRLLSILMALVMVLSSAVPCFADEDVHEDAYVPIEI